MADLTESELNVKKIIMEKYDRSASVDLLPYMIDFAFSENIFSKYAKGSIRILDSAGLRSILPMVGDEFITFFVNQPYTDELTSFTFVVDSIVSASKEELKSESYSINFVASEYLNSLILSHSKSYKNTKISDIILDITKDTHVIVDKDTTEGNIDFIIPNYDTNEALAVLTGLALNEQYVSDFTFYGGLDGSYRFKSLSKLFEQDSSHDLFFIDRRLERNTQEGVFKSNVLAETFNKMRVNSLNITNGAFGSELYQLNPWEKSFDFQNYSLKDELDRFQQLNGGSRFWSKDWFDYVTQSSSRKYVSRSGQKDFVSESILTRNSQKNLIENIVATLTLTGDLSFKVGQIVEYLRPSSSPEFNADGEKFDKQYRGRYLITSVLHSVDNTGKFITNIQIVTDSFAT